MPPLIRTIDALLPASCPASLAMLMKDFDPDEPLQGKSKLQLIKLAAHQLANETDDDSDSD